MGIEKTSGIPIDDEDIAKAKQARSVEELLALAEENGRKLSASEAEGYFKRINQSGELADEELGNVAGGGCSGFTVCASCGYPLDKIDGQWVCRACGKRF